MSNAARLAMAIASLALTLSAQPVAAELELEDPLSHEVAVANATAEQQAIVVWALDRYEAAALPIPAITITFHPNSDGCHGYLGYYDPTPKTLDMCNWGQHHKITPASTLLHELAHAWSFENMTEADRTEFTEHRGLERWHHDGIWWHMGQEQAAEIIAWAIGGDEFSSVYINEESCTSLTQAFVTLTDSEPNTDCGLPTIGEPSKVRPHWRTTPDDYCEIGTTCAYCWHQQTRTLGCSLKRAPGRLGD